MEPKEPVESGFDTAAGPLKHTDAPPRRSWCRRFAGVLHSTGILHPDEWPVRRLLGTALVLAIIVAALAIMSQGVGYVKENQVGVMVNNWSGNLELRDRVGYHLFCPYLSSFFVLEKTIQRFDMTWSGGLRGGSDVKLKTADGSDVSLDVTLTYKLIPAKAVTVLRQSGLGDRFGRLWIESFARHACFSTFGRLTTEEMYDSVKRSEQAQSAHNWLNEQLRDQGIEIVALIPGEFRFYREYEQVIQEKKLADQEVEEQQAQARMLLQDQNRQLIEAQNRANTAIASFEGECANRIIQARAEVEKMKREADGYYHGTLIAADAELYNASSQAAGKRADLFAEAESLDALRDSLAGEGGVGMVGLEYAKRLQAVRFSGTPIMRESTVRQFAVQPEEAAATQSRPNPPAPNFSQQQRMP